MRLASRLHWRLLIGTILVLMAAAWLAPRWVKAPLIQENRVLAERPAWPKGIREVAAYRRAADAYVADRFPIRPHLIGMLNRLRMLAGVSGSDRVLVGREGWLFYDDGTHLGAARGDPPMTAPEVRNWLATLAGRTEALRARGVPYLVVAAPVKETIYPDLAPAWFKGPSSSRPTVRLSRLAAQTGAGEVLYLHGAVAAATAEGQKTFSRHDTHWTGYGAYAGYAALMNRLHAMGLTEAPLPFSAFTLASARDHPPRDLASMLGVSSFVRIDFPHIDNPAGVARATTTYLTAKQDWTAPQVIETGERGKPTLLMTRDSFSNEILPMLLPHFSRIVLAHNDDGRWRPDLIDRFKPDIVIIEVVEHGLRVSMRDGPDPSAAAAARIDKVLSVGAAAYPAAPALAPPDARERADIAAAKPLDRCNIDIAGLKRESGLSAGLSIAGWMWDRHSLIGGAADGLVRLEGPGTDLVARFRVDRPRDDVAEVFHDPRAHRTGFAGDFVAKTLPAGPYTATVYRRAGSEWLACPTRKTLPLP